jgi:hypothetical protein
VTENSLVILTHEKRPLLVLEPQTISGKPSQIDLAKQETVKVRLECPRCCWIFEVPKPDNKHPNCTYNKQETTQANGSIIEESRVCRNPKCKKQFTIYWHKKSTANKNA